MDGFFQQAIQCEVLPKDAHWQLAAWQLRLPVVIMDDWIAVHCLMFSTMNAEICLAVTVQIKLAQRDPPVCRSLEDSGGDARFVPRHFPGKTDVNRQQFHQFFVFICHTLPAISSFSYNIIDRLCRPVAPFGSAGLGVATWGVPFPS